MYSFWEYLGGGIVLAALLGPLIGAALIQASVFIVAMFGSFLDMGKKQNDEKLVTMKVRRHDYDEDEY